MATIAVPQRKKGVSRRRTDQTEGVVFGLGKRVIGKMGRNPVL